MTQNKQSDTKYIVAWLLMWLSHKLVGFAAEILIESFGIKLFNIFKYMWLVDSLLMILSSIIIFNLIYFKLFKNLDAAKVLIYIYTLGSLGVILSIGKTLQAIDKIGFKTEFDSFIYSWSLIVSWILSLLIIRHQVLSRKPFLTLPQSNNGKDMRDFWKKDSNN